jgi:hypothetical protein
MSENTNPSIEIEIEGDAQIEIVDDTPAPDRGKPEPKGAIEVTDDEISQYSDNVQKRIRQLRAGYHEERREKERLAREQQEALTYAQRVAEQNRMLQDRLSQVSGCWWKPARKSMMLSFLRQSVTTRKPTRLATPRR